MGPIPGHLGAVLIESFLVLLPPSPALPTEGREPEELVWGWGRYNRGGLFPEGEQMRGRWRGLAIAVVVAALLVTPGRAADEELAPQLAQLVEQLERGDSAERAAAERAIVELGLAAPARGDALLALLPEPSEEMSQEMATRLARVRAEVQTKLAERNVQQSRVTLNVKEAPLAEVLAELEKQTGNSVIDYRGEFSDEVMEKKVTLKVDDAPFWEALDLLMDETAMSPYPYAADGALGLVDRPEGSLRRVGRGAAYAGPFRVEATNASSRRGLRSPAESGFNVELEITWEPRLRPVGLAHAAADLAAKSDDGLDVPASGEGELFNVEVPADYQAVEASLAMQLPARGAKNLASLKGQVMALVPGRVAELKFRDLATAADVVQDAGGVTVTLNRVSRNQSLWEFRMRIRVASLDADAEASRGWVFQNVTYLESKDGERVDHAGFETTMQDEREIGFAYFFELPEGADIGDYTWVYRTPAAIVNLPVEYELSDIPLP